MQEVGGEWGWIRGRKSSGDGLYDEDEGGGGIKLWDAEARRPRKRKQRQGMDEGARELGLADGRRRSVAFGSRLGRGAWV